MELIKTDMGRNFLFLLERRRLFCSERRDRLNARLVMKAIIYL